MISLCLYFLGRPVSKKVFAGAGADNPSSLGGAFPFNVSALPSWTRLSFGSAFIYIMLVAGASIGGISAIRGALAFAVSGLPSGSDWNVGSAYNL